jgi:outer membrane protein assembly factor BamD
MYLPVLMSHTPAVLVRFALVGSLLIAGGCGWWKPLPTPILPPDQLYQKGESDLERQRYEDARKSLTAIVERHPDSSYAPRARFLVGETYYRDADFDKAIKEFEGFIAFYPRHQIADLVQYRLAMSYYDQLKPVEQDQGLTAKALQQFKKLVKEYPESRYATDGLAKIDICRGRIAQKELWVATYYYNQGNPSSARQRLELVLKDYPRTLVVPETLWLLAEVNFHEGRNGEAVDLLRRLSSEFSYTEWGRRAAERLRGLNAQK